MVERELLNGTVVTPKQDKEGEIAPVMSGLTIKELQMVPHLASLARLDAIEVGGTTRISEEVVAAITAKAVGEIPGVAEVGLSTVGRFLAEALGGAERAARGVEAEVGRKEAIVDVTVRIIYGNSIPAAVVAIRYNVTDRLLGLCGLVAKEINIRVAGLEFPDRMPGRVV